MPRETKRARRWALALAGCALWGAGAATVRGDEPRPAAADVQALKEQFRLQQQEIDRQTQLIEQMKKRVAGLREPAPAAAPAPAEPAGPGELPAPPAPDRGAVEKMVGDYLQRRDAERAAEAAAARERAESDGHKVGSDLDMRVRWNVLNSLTFETANKDFVTHFGLWIQYDNVAFTQSPALKAPSQLGNLEDGTFFRRIRPQWDGTAWEVMEWDIQLQLEAINNDLPQLDEAFAGLMNLPVVGTLRVGKTRIPQGLEPGSFTSSKPQAFMEQSAFGSAFYEDLGVGVWTNNSVLDGRVTWAAMFYRQDNVPGGSDANQAGASFGDGKYAWAGRLTALPIYENEGRQLLHLGASLGWRKAEDVPAPAGTQGGINGPTFIDFRTRPLLRDSIGDYGGTNGNSATPVGLPGNSKQIIDTGLLTASSSWQVGTEFLYLLGPFSLQAEYGWASANDVFIPNPSKTGPKTLALGDVWFSGYYVQVSYFLTGENRRYDQRYGRLSRLTTVPYTPFWLTKGEDGNWLFGRGAWELAARWNHLSLNNGFIQGGQTDAIEVGVNWYLNPNVKVMVEYLHQNRYDKSTGPGGTLPGDIDGLGVRTQIYF